MAPREEDSIPTTLNIPPGVSITIKDSAVNVSTVPVSDVPVDPVPVEVLQGDVDPEECVPSLVDTVSELVVSLPISQVALQLAEGGLEKVGPVLEKAGDGLGMVKEVQRTARRLRRAGAKSEGNKTVGHAILKIADFMGINFLLGFSGLKLRTIEADCNKAVYTDSEESPLILLEDYLEDYNSEEDPDYNPGGEEYEESSSGCSSDEEQIEEELNSCDELGDVIVPVVVKHEMVSPEAVCRDLDNGDVIFEKGHCVPMVVKTEAALIEETETFIKKFVSENIESLTVEEAVSGQEQVTYSPAIVLEEIGPVSARISALERNVEIEKSPRLDKTKIAEASDEVDDLEEGEVSS